MFRSRIARLEALLGRRLPEERVEILARLLAAYWARKKGGSPEVTQADRELARACVAEGGSLAAALAEALGARPGEELARLAALQEQAGELQQFGERLPGRQDHLGDTLALLPVQIGLDGQAGMAIQRWRGRLVQLPEDLGQVVERSRHAFSLRELLSPAKSYHSPRARARTAVDARASG